MADGYYEPQRNIIEQEIAKSQSAILGATSYADGGFQQLFLSITRYKKQDEAEPIAKSFQDSMTKINAISRAFRADTRGGKFAKIKDLIAKGMLTEEAVAKSTLDVGTLTNFAQITGGQSLGYVSLDTQMARGTARPNSFTLYQCLHKSAAYQVVDYWPYAYATGGGMPGTAYQSYSSVSTGTLATSAGKYELNNITLKLALDGRAITTALAAQNSFVDIAGQETINASLTVLESTNWACYWGNVTLWPNQQAGIASQLPTANVFDWYQWNKTYATAQGWSNAQACFNLIYEASAQITGFRAYGRITHAFMTPVCASTLQGLVTTLLNNIVTNITPTQERLHGIVVNGDLQGMRTRFGEIQFPIDLFISARDAPAQSYVLEDGTNLAVSPAPHPPSGVVAVPATGVAGSAWDAAFVAGSGIYSYAVASTDAAMNESVLAYVLPTSGATVISVSGVAVGGAYALSIAGPTAADATVFRIFRSGLGYSPATSAVANAASYRYVGAVAANGSATVTWNDLNTSIPGSENIFLLDMDENDMAIDFRFLLPLSRIDLFAQNLYMPWAVAMIGAVRLRIPKFHGRIKNFIPDNPQWNPLAPNASASNSSI